MTKFDRGDKIIVEYEAVEYEDGGRTEKTVIREDIGIVTAIPSQKFEGYNLDYELVEGNAIRSINLETEVVEQLIYRAGGDMESDTWNLVSVSHAE